MLVITLALIIVASGVSNLASQWQQSSLPREFTVVAQTASKKAAVRESKSPVESGRQGTRALRVFFSNDKLDPKSQDCGKVYPVDRTVPKTAAVAKAALGQLFDGPTKAERARGYRSWFSEETKSILKSIKVRNRIAYVDLTDIRRIIPGVSSSCGSAEFLAEVETTLKQFPTIRRVIFAIEGKPATFYEWIGVGCVAENNYCSVHPFR